MQDQTVLSLVIVGSGLFSAAGGYFAWPFFMNSRKAQRMVRLMGPAGARGFYIVLGLVLCGLGTGIGAGWLR